MQESFQAFVEDQLVDVPGLRLRPMFGGCGLYAGNVFFGILFRDRLYFRTDDRTVARYRARRLRPFRPNAKQTLQSYYHVPEDVVEDRDELRAWADEARATAAARRPESEP